MTQLREIMRTIIVAIILILLPISNIAPSSTNELEQKVLYEIGTNSNYSLETLTDISASHRAKHVTLHNHTNGIDITYFDDYLNVWRVEQNLDGVWTSNVYASQKSTADPFEFVTTSFGIFNVQQTTVLASANCSGNQLEYNFEVFNLSNSSSNPLQFGICGVGTSNGYHFIVNNNQNGAATVSDNFFSFAFTTCERFPGYPVYKDHMVTIFADGTSENHSFGGRHGVGSNTLCPTGGNGGIAAPNVISAGNLSCITAEGTTNGGWTGWADSLSINCVNNQNNSLNFGNNFCHGKGSCGSQKFYSINQELFYLESNSYNGGTSSEILWKFNESGYHDMSSLWMPESCQGNGFQYMVSLGMHCGDDLWAGWGYDMLWNPHDNSTIAIPDLMGSTSSFTLFKAGNVGPNSNWIFIKLNPLNGYDIKIAWTDFDMDSYHDLLDDLPTDGTQYGDLDKDGYGDSLTGNNPDSCPFQPGDSTIDRYGCSDFDQDGYSDLGDIFPSDYWQWNDTDGDGYGDNNFSSPGYLNVTFGGTKWDDCPNEYGLSTRNDTLGCPDSDFDGWADSQDAFKNDSSQWEDIDGDGYGDQLNGLQGDSCSSVYGNSTEDRFGCIDSDGDGWSDGGDDLPLEPTQWKDRDGDGYGENPTGINPDAFPSDGTQWNDTDGDGHGDNPYGTEGDWFPNNPTRWQDSDRDGIADEDDAFPNEVTQWNDTDGDGYGDEETGNRGDAFPNDVGEWADSDMDGLGDNADAFPFDPTQTEDRDGDGMGDNPMGIGADKFPDDATQWGDIDGDGYGDNPLGNYPDIFITDATQWSDADGDGYGDNPSGRLYDMFPENPTQWEDADGDGLGDNQNGTEADPYLNDFDNDGYNDSIDILPKLPSPGDLDADGCLDEDDAFPSNSQECLDNDGDGEGDNADVDDDNDGWADTEEIRLNTDPFNSADEPVESFEIVIPGTSVGLGAWDLIGMFGGIPLFVWIGFGFVTRNTRCAKYEAMLREANTRDELESVAYKWEYSLMLRMLGPHQGIRLERLRAELDDKFEAMNQSLSSIDNHELDQTQMVVEEMNDTEKQVPEINSQSDYPLIEDVAHKTDDNGYEWFIAQDGTNFYRTSGSQADWTMLEN